MTKAPRHAFPAAGGRDFRDAGPAGAVWAGVAVLGLVLCITVAGCESYSASTTAAPLGSDVERVVMLEP